MARPRKGTEEVFFDTFADWPADDQAAALRVLEQIHRQTKRNGKWSGNRTSESVVGALAETGTPLQGALPGVKE